LNLLRDQAAELCGFSFLPKTCFAHPVTGLIPAHRL